MENVKTKTLEAIDQNRLFDFLSNHHWELDKEDLANIAKELAYTLLDLRERAGTLPILEDAIDDLKKNLSDVLSDE